MQPDYIVQSSPRRKRLAMMIDQHGQLIIKTPLKYQQKQIDQFIQQNLAWIKKQQAKPKKPQISFEEHSEHWLWGIPYPLKIIQGYRTHLTKQSDHFLITTKETYTPELGQKLFKKFYQAEAKKVFPQKLDAIYQMIKHIGLPEYQDVSVKNTKTRWGSCSSKHNINLALNLIHFPPECLDYIIVHELCHLREMNHSENFYALMDQAMPNWREVKKQLKALAHKIPLL